LPPSGTSKNYSSRDTIPLTCLIIDGEEAAVFAPQRNSPRTREKVVSPRVKDVIQGHPAELLSARLKKQTIMQQITVEQFLC
jgi:hypothetical protein